MSYTRGCLSWESQLRGLEDESVSGSGYVVVRLDGTDEEEDTLPADIAGKLGDDVRAFAEPRDPADEMARERAQTVNEGLAEKGVEAPDPVARVDLDAPQLGDTQIAGTLTRLRFTDDDAALIDVRRDGESLLEGELQAVSEGERFELTLEERLEGERVTIEVYGDKEGDEVLRSREVDLEVGTLDLGGEDVDFGVTASQHNDLVAVEGGQQATFVLEDEEGPAGPRYEVAYQILGDSDVRLSDIAALSGDKLLSGIEGGQADISEDGAVSLDADEVVALFDTTGAVRDAAWSEIEDQVLDEFGIGDIGDLEDDLGALIQAFDLGEAVGRVAGDSAFDFEAGNAAPALLFEVDGEEYFVASTEEAPDEDEGDIVVGEVGGEYAVAPFDDVGRDDLDDVAEEFAGDGLSVDRDLLEGWVEGFLQGDLEILGAGRVEGLDSLAGEG